MKSLKGFVNYEKLVFDLIGYMLPTTH